MSHNNYIVNKYFYCYYNIINNRTKNPPIGYIEKHHILPKCLGGTNDASNIVRLTAREHFICHLLLVKITRGDANKKMRRAVGMFKMITSKLRRTPTPRQYESIRKITANLPNSMSDPKTKAKHLDSIARKIGYENHQTYLSTVKLAFKKYKTIKTTSNNTGHSQYAIRHLLLNNFGKEWVESVRHEGLVAGRLKSIESNRNRPKRDSSAEKNYNAYIWKATSPDGDTYTIKGNRLEFCKIHSIGTSLDIKKPHLRGFWEFEKLCKTKDYSSNVS